MTAIARRTLFCLLASACLLLAALQPTFHTATRLVQINVVVRDKNGPVANLTKNDFLLTDQGKPRTISVFAVNSIAGNAGDRTQPEPSLPANTFSNLVGAPPSVTVVLLDRLNTLTGSGAQNYEENPSWSEELAISNAKQHLIRFVSTLNPKDRVAIYSLGKSIEVLSDFSSDRARLLEILEKYQPISLTRREDTDPLPIHTPAPGDFNASVDRERQRMAAMANTNRAETTLAALAAIATHVAAIPGRKNLVWLASSLSISPAAAAQVVSRANIAIYPVDARGLLPVTPPRTEEDSHLVFGRLDGGWTRQGPEPPGLQTMSDLATETGGRAFLNTNDLAGAIRAAVDDAAVTYTLGFYVDEAALDGKFHELKVRVKKASYDVRHPRGYFALREEPASHSALFNAILTPLESSAIGLTARIDRKNADSLTVTGVIHLADLELTPQPDLHSGVVQVYVLQQDAAGAVLDRSEERLDLRLNDELYARYLKSGILFRETIMPRNGLATLRVLAAAGSRAGSLIIPAAQLP
jgi:VWFA-related protein